MTAYVIGYLDVHDRETYRGYAALVPATLEPFGGSFLVRGGEHATVEGDWQPHRVVVLAFPDIERARAWYASAEYTRVKPIRQRAASRSLLLVVDGVA